MHATNRYLLRTSSLWRHVALERILLSDLKPLLDATVTLPDNYYYYYVAPD